MMWPINMLRFLKLPKNDKKKMIKAKNLINKSIKKNRKHIVNELLSERPDLVAIVKYYLEEVDDEKA